MNSTHTIKHKRKKLVPSSKRETEPTHPSGPEPNTREEGDKQGHQEVAVAKQVERPADDMRSWPHAVVYPPRYPPPYHHHHQYVARGHGPQVNHPHNGAYVAGGRGARESHPSSYVAHGHGARELLPNTYPYAARGYGAQENPPNACAIC